MTDAWAEIGAKAVVYAATLMAVGAGGLRWLLLPQIRRVAPPTEWQAWEHRTDETLLRSACAVLVGLVLRVWTHTITAFGFADAWILRNVAVIGFESRWGRGWRVQGVVGVILVSAALWSRVHRVSGRLVCGTTVVVLCAVLPLTGHAAGSPWRIAMHGTHVLAGGLWLGTLAMVATGRTSDLRALQSHLLRAFAPMAMTGATLLTVSGALATWIYLGSLSNFWRTDYGRLLALKLVLVSCVMVVGALNWRWLHRRLAKEAHQQYLLVEVILAVSVVLLTAWLSETAHPL